MPEPNRIYFFGARDGRFVKIGKTEVSLTKRRGQLEKTLEGRVPLVLLAALAGEPTHETAIHRHFERFRLPDTRETYQAAPELTEYINWLRHQWFTTLEESEVLADVPDFRAWFPEGEGDELRQIGPPEEDEDKLFNIHISFTGALAKTGWAWMATPGQNSKDFYTPPEVVDAARLAMGGIDLDPASHWIANRTFRIPEWYHPNRNAMEHPWFGRIWLNPPYGENRRWFDRIIDQWDTIDQLCMISPVWAFTTIQASEFMSRAAASVLLSPTPEFWGRADGKTGTNHPHMIVYVGKDTGRFFRAFRDFGIPIKLLEAEPALT